MNSFWMPFILSTIAGLSTLVGTIFLFIRKKNKDFILTSSLAFASGVMFFLSIIDLVPEGYHFLLSTFNDVFGLILSLFFMVLGIVVSIFIDKVLPIKDYNKDNLYKVGIFSMLAIIIHNVPEGIATFITASSDISLGIKLVIAITLHNIPEGISIALPIYYSTKSKKKAFFYTFLSGLSEPFGAIITFLFLSPFITDTLIGCLFNLIAGIMFYIALYELLPTSLKYKKFKITSLFFIFGILFVLVTSIFF